MGGDANQTLTIQPRRGRGSPQPQPHLFIALEAARPLAGGARCTLAGVRSIAVGRGEERSIAFEGASNKRDVRITVPDSWMSSEHARITRTPSGWILEDAGSKNGVSVNGATVDRHYLGDGDVIELGRTFLVLRTGLPTPETTAPTVESTESSDTRGFSSLIPALAASFERAAKMATTASAIAVLGPTGSGKELCARALHDASGRSGRFVAVNCGALADSVLESELFGYVAGAFSGAVKDRVGLIESSSGGTLFLDEIGELGAKAQAALLRVLQEKEIRPVGANEARDVDLHVLSATHQPVAALAERGDFREDLLARIAGFEMHLPPLCDRREDLGHIIATLLPRISKRPTEVAIAEDVARAYLAYGWPRNVRELEASLLRALTLGDGVSVEATNLEPTIGSSKLNLTRAKSESEELGAEDEERRTRLIALLNEHEGNVSAVAREMGALRQTVQKWLKRYGVDARDYRT